MKKIYLFLPVSFLIFLACGGLTSQQNVAAKEAIDSLSKIDASVQVGVDRRTYGLLVIDAKAKVNAAIRILPDGKLKTDLDFAMYNFEEANNYWNRHGDKITEYMGDMDYWKDARGHLESARDFFSQ